MPRRRTVEARRVIFIGVEGKSDQAFVQFLQSCCNREGLHLHLKVETGNGGDSVTVVKEAARRLTRKLDKREIWHSLVLLDGDRYAQDVQAGRDPQTMASKSKLEIIFQNPNLEGLLLRLHQGYENRTIVADDSITELRKVWPEYRKSSLTAEQLKRRFTVSDLRRAGLYDKGLRRLLDVIGLWAPDH